MSKWQNREPVTETCITLLMQLRDALQLSLDKYRELHKKLKNEIQKTPPNT